MVFFIRSGTVLTDWETEAFGLPRKYPDSCLPITLHQPDTEETLSDSFRYLPLRFSSEIPRKGLALASVWGKGEALGTGLKFQCLKSPVRFVFAS